MPAESPTLGLSHLQFEALLTAARESANVFDFALVTMLGLLGLRIFEACTADITDVGEEHGHRVLRVCGKGSKIVLVPLPPAVGRALDRATTDRTSGPILLNRREVRMDRHCATRRLRGLAEVSVVRLPRMHPHMLRHTFVTTMLDAGVDLRDVQIAARHADPRTTMRYDRAAKTSTGTRTTSSPLTWPPARDTSMQISTRTHWYAEDSESHLSHDDAARRISMRFRGGGSLLAVEPRLAAPESRHGREQHRMAPLISPFHTCAESSPDGSYGTPSSA